MKHARSDYQARIQDVAGLIPADEPVFFIRGQDKAAPGNTTGSLPPSNRSTRQKSASRVEETSLAGQPT